MPNAKYTTIDGNKVSCPKGYTLWVEMPDGKVVSVLPVGTHAALNVFGDKTKKKMVDWWKTVRLPINV